MTPEQRAAIGRAGYLPFALDLSGARLLAPDGLRTVTVEQALAELEAASEEDDAA